MEDSGGEGFYVQRTVHVFSVGVETDDEVGLPDGFRLQGESVVPDAGSHHVLVAVRLYGFHDAASKLSLSVALWPRSISTASSSNVTSGSSSTSGAWLSGKMNKAGNQ